MRLDSLIGGRQLSLMESTPIRKLIALVSVGISPSDYSLIIRATDIIRSHMSYFLVMPLAVCSSTSLLLGVQSCLLVAHVLVSIRDEGSEVPSSEF